MRPAHGAHALLTVGEPFDLMPYGLEAMEYLRIEKGHVAGPEIDGRASPHDLGMGAMCRSHFVGGRSLALPAFADVGRQVIAGFISADRRTPIAAGAQLLAKPFDGGPQDSLGRITSTASSPTMDDCPIALGFVAADIAVGTTLYAVSPLTDDHTRVEVTRPVFHDPEGEKLRG